ncbi:C-C motif chemokine 19a.1 [Myxocyprinus asiaticus]|uniref:C-C motif chemokine 19a.1 n=1 Tax=Myxocyprinus asiaticus TaxID=70543 RepID=UPI00222168A9|nr:C-C motif chemokine 19a.1 [Myxocyprinus asiaticus]
MERVRGQCQVKGKDNSHFSRTVSIRVPPSPVPVAMASAVLPALSVYLCALALILCNSPAEAQPDLALDCCLTVSQQSIPRHILLSYRKQFRGDGCPCDAVVFTTRKGRKLCAPPATKAQWVGELTKFLDTRLRKCKETKFQGKRCEGLKPLSD